MMKRAAVFAFAAVAFCQVVPEPRSDIKESIFRQDWYGALHSYFEKTPREL